MSLTDHQKRIICDNIGELDYLSGNGMSEKRKMIKELFLIIGSGGVGGRVLREIKNLALQQFEKSDIENQIMFLYADTNYYDLNHLLESKELEEEEVLRIPYEGAKKTIHPDYITPAMREWVHPELYEFASSRSGFMDGMGASSMRQCGRVLFAQPECQNRLYQRLQGIRDKAGKIIEEGIQDIRVNVIFLVGLAGGTGSGTIIDLGFLTRYYLRQILPELSHGIRYGAFLFMPSASVTTSSEPGAATLNQNAYAALKEINYYMELKNHNDAFRMDFGTPLTHNLVIKDNLFDFCTLIEGVDGGGVFFGDPRDTARKITALSIINSFYANQSDQTGRDVAFADAFLDDPALIQISDRIRVRSDRVWPREADYHFETIGYASCVVPVDLLSLYAFKKVFDQIYHVFKKDSQATPQMAQSFLEQCGLAYESVVRHYSTYTPHSVSVDIEKISDGLFLQHGPWFMISLTKQVFDLIHEPVNGLIAQAQRKMNSFFGNIHKWQYIISLYTYVGNLLLQRSNNLYDVYAFVIEEMLRFLQADTDILTKTEDLKKVFGHSFYWTPVDLTSGPNKTTAITQYLDEIMNPQKVRQLADEFVRQMHTRKERWTSLKPSAGGNPISFDVADEIRDFVRNKMNDIVGKTLEDYIVIAYSGDPHARPSEMQGWTEVPSHTMKSAARAILGRLCPNAALLTSVRQDFRLDDCYHRQYLTIPADCRWLYEAIREEAAACHLSENDIFLCSANDRIACISRYEGLPAWALCWSSRAEEDYEMFRPAGSIGIHIEQGIGGRKAMELPNLIPAGLWTDRQAMINRREKSIIWSVRDDMKEALDRGLLIPHQDLYLMTRFAKGETADTLWTFLQMTKEEKCTTEHMLDLLKKSGKAHDLQVIDFGTVTTDPGILTPEGKDAFAYDLSCRIVRKNDLERRELARTLAIGRELQSRLEELNKE